MTGINVTAGPEHEISTESNVEKKGREETKRRSRGNTTRLANE